MTRPTHGRIKCMAALAYGKLRLGESEKEKLVESLCPGKTSFRALTNQEADRVINALKRQAGQVPMKPVESERRQARAQGVTGLPTPAQREMIAELTRALLQAGLSAAYVEGVRFRACGRPSPITSAEAGKVIEALDALLARVNEGWRPREEPA